MDTDINTSDKDELAGDLLVGFEDIQKYLAYLGMRPDVDIYRLKREGQWPIGKTSGTSGSLIASKRKLRRYVDKLTTPKTTAA
jgi:hypothetical protein